MHVPDSFKSSYSKFTLYPCNLIDTGYYHSTLENYRQKLKEDAGGLFIDDSNVVDITLPVWDAIVPTQAVSAPQNVQPDAPQVLDKWYIRDDDDLMDFLSDQSTLTAASSTYTGELATRPDSRCRYMLVHDSIGNRSHQALQLTPSQKLPISASRQSILFND